MANFQTTVIFLCLVLLLLMIFNNVSDYDSQFFLSRDRWYRISLKRLILGLVINAIIAIRSLRKKSLNKSGAIASYLVGFILFVSNRCFFVTILSFFIFGSQVTKFRSSKKTEIEDNYHEGGQRNWIQVICNGGIASILALMYFSEYGTTEKLIHNNPHSYSSRISLAFLGSIAACCGDTFSSEIGSVMSSSKPYSIISWKQVPAGTNGAISFHGTIASFVGGLLIGITYYLSLFLFVEYEPSMYAFEAPLILLSGMSGLVGSIFDSLLGALFQYSGFDTEKNKVVNYPDKDVVRISGYNVLSNHDVNLITSFFMCLIVPLHCRWNVDFNLH